MKRFITTVIVCLLFINAALADEKEPPHVTIFGTATAEVVPDVMNWSVRVQTRGLKLNDVAQEHDKSVQTVLALLKNSKLPETNIQTAAMQFGENWEFRSNERYRNGYIATTYITFKLKDFGLYKTLWFGLADMPSVSVESATFDHTRRTAIQDETREKAMRSAKDKASGLAQAIGSEIGEPLFIEEEQPEIIWPRYNFAMARAKAAGPAEPDSEESLSPGTISIKARVHASFRLITGSK